MEIKAIKTTHSGKDGFFIENAEMEKLKTLILGLKENEEKAKGEAKYKLKKLSKIIERKEKTIEQLSKRNRA